ERGVGVELALLDLHAVVVGRRHREVRVRVLAEGGLEDLAVVEHLVVLHVASGATGHRELHPGRSAGPLRKLLGQRAPLVQPLLRQVFRHTRSLTNRSTSGWSGIVNDSTRQRSTRLRMPANRSSSGRLLSTSE